MKLRIKKDYTLRLHDFSTSETFTIVEVYGAQEIELYECDNYPEAEEAFEKITEFYKKKPNKKTIYEISI